MKMLLGLTAPSSGELHIFGEDIRTAAREILPRVGSLIESPGFYPNLTGTENLKIFAVLRDVKQHNAIQNALELVGLPYRDKKLYAQYSLGMKQRLAIALAIMHNPELLILDEPINGLDPIGIAEVRSFIHQEQRVFIFNLIVLRLELTGQQTGCPIRIRKDKSDVFAVPALQLCKAFFLQQFPLVNNPTQMVLTKIIVLFLMGILFSLASTFATILCGSVVAEVGGLAYKLLASVMLGIFSKARF